MIERLLKEAAIISIDGDEMLKAHCETNVGMRRIMIDLRIETLRNLEPLLAEYNNFELADAEMDELTLLLIEELLKEVENLRETTELFEEWVRDCPI